MRAIVLSGGGSKGAYQIGVWKALRKLNIKYDIVTGTSVGALNAALITQNKYLKALLFWRNLTFENVIDDKIDKNITKKDLYKKYVEGAMNGGLKISNLEKTIDKALNVRKIYSSKIDMGLVTVKAKGLKPLELRKKDIPIEKFKDYLVASASCYPAFSMKKIGGNKYLDGGMYDNMPINLAIDMGATEVIAVDLEAIGIKRKVKNQNIPITYISPNNDIGSFLIFEKNMARRAIRLGYNDTLKKFKKLDGNKYTFNKDELKKLYEQQKDLFKEKISKLTKKSSILEIGIYKKILNSNWEKEYIKMIEKLLEAFAIDDSYIYSIDKMNRLLINKFNQLEESISIDKYIKEHKLKSLLSNKLTIKHIYDLNNQKYALLFPNEFLMATYLKIIIDNN